MIANTHIGWLDRASTSSLQRAEETNLIIRELGQGYFARVFLSIPKQAANETIAQFAARAVTAEQRSDLLANLRTCLRVLKISRDREVNGKGLDTVYKEAAVLNTLCRIQHANIMRLITADTSGPKGWFAMPVCSVNLQQVLNSVYQTGNAEPIAFAWHVCLEMAKAFLYLHHGVLNDGRKESNWPLVAHGDTRTGNFLFMPVGEGGDVYPRMLLADFDRAKLVPADCSQSERTAVLQQQRKDLEALICYAECAARRINDPALERWSRAIANIETPGAYEMRDDRAFHVLYRFVKAAKRRSDRLYLPLPDDLLALFEQPSLTDQELVTVFPSLAESTPMPMSRPKTLYSM